MLKWAIGAAAVLAAVLILRSFIGVQDAEWQERVERVQAEAAVNLALADSALALADTFETQALALAAEAEKRDTVIIRMVEQLPAPPADCEPFTAPRDSVILQMEERHKTNIAAFERQRKASVLLRAAEARAHRAADSLVAVLDDRPQPVSPLIPTIGLGATAGVCTTGQPCVAFGLQLSWEVNLF